MKHYAEEMVGFVDLPVQKQNKQTEQTKKTAVVVEHADVKILPLD